MAELYESYAQQMIMYHGGVTRMVNHYIKEEIIKKINVLLVGPAGCGKTFLAHELFRQVLSSLPPPSVLTHYSRVCVQIFGEEVEVYDKDPMHKWFSNYRGQPAIIMNEAGARTSKISLAQYNRWLDTRTHEEETKGAERMITAQCWILTSNREPATWWDDVDAPLLEALLGRLDVYYLIPQFHGVHQECSSHCRGGNHPYRIWKHGLPDPVPTPQRVPLANEITITPMAAARIRNALRRE